MSNTFKVTPDLQPTNRKFSVISLGESIQNCSGLKTEAGGHNTELSLLGTSAATGRDYYEGIHESHRMNGFMRAVHLAFDNHWPLALSPDDIWLAISQGFATHVNLNADKLRELIVPHEGQINLELSRENFVKGSPTNDWVLGFREFSEKIVEYQGEKLVDLMIPSFSTTGPCRVRL